MVDLEADATLVWAEEVMLGRWCEPSGSLSQRMRIDRAGSPLVRADLTLGPLWPGSQGPAGVGDALAVATVVVVGPDARDLALPEFEGVNAAVLRMADDAAVVSAVASRPGQCRRLTSEVLRRCCSGARPV